MKKKYFKDLDIIRDLSCIAVLLYHLNILKGGYLAVCIFFVLSGYLACVSAFNKEKFSFLTYYKNRLLHVYLPLLIVVLSTITCVSLLSEINWISLKPETTSVLLGYNNFWQLNANLDYFARHINSPFMHFWYIGILLQFELIFPFVFIILKKLGDKTKKIVPCIIIGIITLLATVYFIMMTNSKDIMIVYYDTFSRIFSLLFGVTLGFINSYYKQLIPKKLNNNLANRIIFYMYIVILITLFITIDATSKLFPISMILTTIITCRLIDYGTVLNDEKMTIINKIIKFIASISYEVYLVQYPVIFLFQYMNINEYLKIGLIILITFIIGYVLHTCLDFKKYKKEVKYIPKYILSILLLMITLFGGYKFITTKDHTKEMQELEDLLGKNQEVMKQKQEEYLSKLKQEEDNWASILADLENDENKLKDIVTNLPIIGVGDSVMLGAVNDLYATFPNGYFDAKVSRTDYEANDILVNLKAMGMLGEPIIFNLGTNGQCGEYCRQQILQTIENRQVFWVTVTNDWEVNVNSDLTNFASKHDNVRIIDWNSISQGHYDYFVADGIHLTPVGRQAYAQAIYDSIYNMYLEEYNKKKDAIISKHEDQLKTKIGFYGNDLLLNAFKDIQENFSDAKYMIDSDLTYEKLIEEIKNEIEDKSLNHRIVFAFDNSLELSNEQYNEIIDLCKEHEIYIIKMNDKKIEVDNDLVTIINFYKEIKTNNNYLMADKVHLTQEGNKALSEIINKTLNNN